MSAEAISLHEYGHALGQCIPAIHPAAQFALTRYFYELRTAAEHEDCIAFAKWARSICAEIAQDLRFQAAAAEEYREHDEALQLRQLADDWCREAAA